MIFRLPYSWLKEYVDVPKNPHDLARQLSLFGPSIEKVEMARHEFTKVVVGEIVSIERHPNADKLQVAMVRAGSGEPLRIVCGAPNIQAGQKVPLALVGAALPSGIRVVRREVRGVVSEGMLCSARELGIHDDHLGILILHPSSKLGSNLTDLGNLTDYILEVEPTTNRPDISSVIGVAREVHAITGKPLKNITIRKSKKPFSCPLTVKVLNKKLCPRFMAVLIKNVSVGASPWWMQERLARAGIRPINAAVDITNYVLLEYGQPLHAFDADKLGSTIIVREAKAGEKLLALDGRTYTLKSDHLVVANAQKPVSIAGVMGGEETAVTDKTANIVLECANFNALSIRRASRELQLFSDSSRLFEKGLSEESPTVALARAIGLIEKICRGEASSIADARARSYRPTDVRFPLSHITKILGVSVPESTVKKLLERLGFAARGQGQTLSVTVPYWRDHDVSSPEDLVEEAARLYGYHRFAPVLPPLALTSHEEKNDFATEDSIRRRLSAMGFTEVMSYSFVRDRWLKAMQYPPKDALKVANPLNNDLVFLRPSLLPSLTAITEANLPNREDIKIFEIAKVYRPGEGRGRAVEHYREEEVFLTGLIVQTGISAERLYRLVKGVVESIYYNGGASADVNAKQSRLKSRPPFAAGLSVLSTGKNGPDLTYGILDPGFLSFFGISHLVAAFELPLAALEDRKTATYRPAPKFPAVKRDLSLALNRHIRYTDLVDVIKSVTPFLESVELFDIYRDNKLGDNQQSYALHLIYRAPDKTLSSEEVEKAEAVMRQILISKFGAIIR